MSEQKQIVETQRIFIKKSVFELIGGSEIFLLQWQPKIEMELKTANNILKESGFYEVTLEINAKVSIADKQVCTFQLIQAGIFRVEGFNDDQLKQILGGLCPDLLYPYLCYAVSHLFTEASLPAIQLKPISFAYLFQQSLLESAKKEAEKEKTIN